MRSPTRCRLDATSLTLLCMQAVMISAFPRPYPPGVVAFLAIVQTLPTFVLLLWASLKDVKEK